MFVQVVSCSKSENLETTESETPIDDDTSDDANSNIIYTDIEPDFISENVNDFYNLDLNNDAVVDFILRSIYLPSEDYYYLEINSGAYDVNGAISVTPWYANPVPLDINREIYYLPSYSAHGEIYALGFFTVGDCFGGEATCYEDWKDKNDKYLGLGFVVEGKIHFGWARVSITSPTNWVIMDYAYNAIPDSSILAGQID